MGTYYNPDGTTIAQLKAEIRSQTRGEIVAECSGRQGGDNFWYVAVRMAEALYPEVPAGSVVAECFIIHPPTKGYGAGYKPVDEFMGPYFAVGVTHKFLAALTPLPAPTEGESRSLDSARGWRALAAAHAINREANRAFVKSLTKGSTFLLPGTTAKGVLTVERILANGAVYARLGYADVRVRKVHLERAIPANLEVQP